MTIPEGNDDSMDTEDGEELSESGAVRDRVQKRSRYFR